MSEGVDPVDYKKIMRVTKRREAINIAYQIAQAGDVVLIVNSPMDIRLKSFKPIWIPCADRARLMPQKKRSSSSTPNTAADLPQAGH